MSEERLAAAQKAARIEIKRRYEKEKIRYFRPFNYQLPFVYSKKSIDVVMGGNRSGKTKTGAYRFSCIVLGSMGIDVYGLPELPVEYPKPPFTAWVVSVDFTNSREVAQPAVLEMIPETAIEKIYYREKSAVDYILLKNGNRIVFKSCDSGWRKFQGAEIPLLWFDEEPDEDVYKECMMRIGKQKRYVIITMTPLQGQTWLVDRILESTSDKNSDMELHQYFTEENKSLSPGELSIIRENYPEDEWITRLKGIPLEKAGLVYPEFRFDIHTYPDIYDFGDMFESMDWYLFIDYGRDLPFAMYLVGVDSRGSIYLHREHYLAGADLEVHAAAARQLVDMIPKGEGREGHQLQLAYSDPSMFDGEKKNKQSIGKKLSQELIKAGVDIAVMKGNNDVDLGIEVIKLLMKVSQDNFDVFSGKMGAPKLFVNRECRKWIWEVRRYRRHISHKLNYENDKPRKVDDHAMDATRYGVTRIRGFHGGRSSREHREKKYHPYT